MNDYDQLRNAPYTPQPVIPILVGLPGSGKSTFSRYLCETAYYRRGHSSNERWKVVNQDHLGDRRTCERVAANHLRRGGKVIIDRCNINSRQRSTWIALGLRFNAYVASVYFNVHLNICIRRVSLRDDHQTLNRRSANIEGVILGFSRDLELPDMSEGINICLIYHEAPSNVEAIIGVILEFSNSAENSRVIEIE